MSQDRRTAILRVSSLTAQLKDEHRARARELLEMPWLLRHDGFGVCFLASIAYVVLKYLPESFVDLTEIAVQAPGLFAGQYKKYQRRVDAGLKPEWEMQELDFLIIRTLGKYFKKIQPDAYLRLKNGENGFADRTDSATQSLRDAFKRGRFAADPEGMSDLATALLGKLFRANISRVGVPRVTLPDWRAVVDSFQKPRAFAILGFDVPKAFYELRDTVVREPDFGSNSSLVLLVRAPIIAGHAIVIDGAPRLSGGILEMPVVSWGKRFVLKTSVDNLQALNAQVWLGNCPSEISGTRQLIRADLLSLR